MVTDPVCKMKIERDKATAQADYVGQVYFFCSDTCKNAFVAEPQKYASGAAPADHSYCGGHK